MTEETMPVAEAATVAGDDRQSYELAFHVLPTVAEGEVAAVVEKLKAEIVAAGGTIFDEEGAERIELAYEVVKHFEGRNRKFKSAYFGWVRFKAETAAIPTLTEEVEGMGEILRHLLIKLTREEELTPFRYHEAMVNSGAVVSTIDIDAEAEATDESETTEETEEATDAEAATDEEAKA